MKLHKHSTPVKQPLCTLHLTGHLPLSPGMFRRITAAASRLLKAESAGGLTGSEANLFYPLEGLNSKVQCLITTHPPLVLLWCQVLLIINYTNYSWWAEVHQTQRFEPTHARAQKAFKAKSSDI